MATETDWSKLSVATKSILERVDVNRKGMKLVIGEELVIPYYRGVITNEIVEEIKRFEKLEENEGYFRTEQEENVLIIHFLKQCF